MYVLLVIVHLIVSAILILVVLLQSGKAGDLASAFGGGGSQTAFGSRSATTLLTKGTAIAAGLFMVTSLGLSIYSMQGGGTVMQDETGPVPQATEPAPVQQPQEGTTPPATTPPDSSQSGSQGESGSTPPGN